MAKKLKASTVKPNCPPHFWEIDSQNVGRCKFCNEVRDFGQELKKLKKLYYNPRYTSEQRE